MPKDADFVHSFSRRLERILEKVNEFQLTEKIKNWIEKFCDYLKNVLENVNIITIEKRAFGKKKRGEKLLGKFTN